MEFSIFSIVLTKLSVLKCWPQSVKSSWSIYTQHTPNTLTNTLTLNIFLIFPDEFLKGGVALQRKLTLKSNGVTTRIIFKPLVSQISLYCILFWILGQSFACNVKLSVFQTASRLCHTRLEGRHSCINKNNIKLQVRQKMIFCFSISQKKTIM